MEEGLYKLEFTTRLGCGSAVVTVSNGGINGKDDMFYYFGLYTVDDDGTVSATVKVGQHTEAPDQVKILGVTNAVIGFAGSVNTNSINLNLRNPALIDLNFWGQLTKI